jgi:hypothetical protein
MDAEDDNNEIAERRTIFAVGARLRPLLYTLAGLLLLLGMMWASDWVTLENERTVYTVDCQDGMWQGTHCTGMLVAGPRYRFRALRQRAEVLFWTVGNTEPSGKLAPCVITNGRNWTCSPCPDAERTITLQMSLGRPVAKPDGPARAFHALPKWRWWLLRGGIALGSDAAN